MINHKIGGISIRQKLVPVW